MQQQQTMFWCSFSRFIKNLLPLYLLWIVSALVHFTDAAECITKGPCKCEAGSTTVDLSPLMEKKTSPLFSNIKAQLSSDKTTYSYSPCSPTFNLTTPGSTATGCHSVFACQHATNNYYFCLGKPDNVAFSGDPEKDSLLITYVCTDSAGKSRTLYVNLKCAKNTEFSVTGERPSQASHYDFTLRTSHACVPHGLSGGSILLILFFVAVVVYMVLGVLFLRFARGARGVEQIPNYEFWKDFPSLIKDGTVFAVGGCKSDQTYEKI